MESPDIFSVYNKKKGAVISLQTVKPALLLQPLFAGYTAFLPLHQQATTS